MNVRCGSIAIVRFALASLVGVVSSCGGGEPQAELRFPSRVGPPVTALGNNDVVIYQPDCRDTERELRARWGIPRAVSGHAVRWSDRGTRWVADLYRVGSDCNLRFTTARYFGVPARPPFPMADIRTGMTREQVRAIAPALASAKTAIELPGIAGGSRLVEFDATDRVEETRWILPGRAVEALEMAWGAGPMWIDAETSTRMRLESLKDPTADYAILLIRQYVPFERWLGDGTSIAVLPAELWTLDFPAFAKKHPELHPDLERPYQITLPATEVSRYDGIGAWLFLDDAKRVVRVSLMFACRTTTMRDRAIEMFERKWGPRRPNEHGWGFERAPNVSVVYDHDGPIAYDDTIFVDLTRPR